MSELFEPFPNILTREIEHEPTRKELASYAEAIDKLVAIGTHLLKWELKGDLVKPTSTDESIIVSLFIKRLLELLDSIARLVEVGATDPSVVLLRTLLEIELSLEFLLNADTERRGKCALIADLYRQLRSFEEEAVKKIMPDLDLQKTEVIRLIDLPALKEVKDEFISLNTNTKNGQFKNRELKWYNLFSKYNTLADLAISLGKFELYTIVYKVVGSNVIHSTDLLRGNLVVEDDMPAIVQMRNPTEMLEVVRVVFLIGKSAYDIFSKRMEETRRQDYIWAIQICKKQHQQVALPHLYRQ